MVGDDSDGAGREAHALRGPTDRAALLTIRDVFDANEPLTAATLDDFVNPSVVEVRLEDGLFGAESARLDVRWTTTGDYKFHNADAEGQNFRWGNHPHGGDYVHVPETEHFHPPPDASSDPETVEASCIEQWSPKLVTLAVIKLCRAAYHSGSPESLNAATNPP